MTLQQAQQKALYALSNIYAPSEAQAIVRLLMEQFTGAMQLPTSMKQDLELSVYHELLLDRQLQELLTHKPLQYVLNRAWFMGLPFFVDPRVLIPRPETEELVAWVLEEHKRIDDSLCKVLDIGTGSGCIAISLKQARNHWEVHALDISAGALEVAQRNADDLGTEIVVDRHDLSGDPATYPHSGFSLIISNPPYIPRTLTGTLAPQVERFEPMAALFVQQDDPLFYYHAIVGFCRLHLEPGGFIYVEVHHDSAADVADLFNSSGFTDVQIRKDMQGVERMVRGQWPGLLS